jgi:hypothetical protein
MIIAGCAGVDCMSENGSGKSPRLKASSARSANGSGNTGRTALTGAAVSAWLIYDMATATETPRQGVMILQYVLLACALFALAGSLLRLISPK